MTRSKQPPPEADADALFERGVELDEQGEVDEAAAAWRRAVEVDPAYGPAWYNLGVIAKDEGRWHDARELFDHALAHDPDDAAGLHCRGHVFQELGEDALARADLARAIEIYGERLDDDPDDAEALFWRGAARARVGDRDAALADLAAAIEREPHRREEAREEVDFRSLADDPEFVRLVAKSGRRRR